MCCQYILVSVCSLSLSQLISQGLYSVAIGGFTEAVSLAFIASALSIAASTLSFFIERDDADTQVVQYYLSTQCTLRASDRPNGNDSDSDINIPAFTHSGHQQIVSTPTSPSLTASSMTPLNDSEKKLILQNRGRTYALGQQMAQVFGIPPKNIELGVNSMLTKYGIVTHVVHHVNDDDLKNMENELFLDTQKDIDVTAQFFVRQLYSTFLPEITDVFRLHFKLSNDFEVTFKPRMNGRNVSANDVDILYGDLKSSVIKMLDRLFVREGIVDKNDKIGFCSSLIDPQEMHGDGIHVILQKQTENSGERRNDTEIEMMSIFVSTICTQSH